MAQAWVFTFASMEIATFESIYVPREKKDGPERLMVVLHGLGDSYEGYRFLPQMLALPSLSYLLVNAPDRYFMGYSWYDFQGDQAKGIVRSREMVFSLLEELDGAGVPASDVFLFGFSQGCLIAVDTALRFPKPLAGVIGVSGYVGLFTEYPDRFSKIAHEQKLLVTHGTHDPVIPFEPSRQQFQELKALGIPIEYRSYEKEHTILPGELKDVREWIENRIKELD